MKNMGLDSLVLVRPQVAPRIRKPRRAPPAPPTCWRGARRRRSVDEAIGDCGLVVGTTARPRSAHWRVLDAREAAAELAAAAAARPVAVLFGSERNGLANEELERCQALMRIPVAAAYESLNLAQAVQIVALRDTHGACGAAVPTRRLRRCRRPPTRWRRSMRTSSA